MGAWKDSISEEMFYDLRDANKRMNGELNNGDAKEFIEDKIGAPKFGTFSLQFSNFEFDPYELEPSANVLANFSIKQYVTLKELRFKKFVDAMQTKEFQSGDLMNNLKNEASLYIDEMTNEFKARFESRLGKIVRSYLKENPTSIERSISYTADKEEMIGAQESPISPQKFAKQVTSYGEVNLGSVKLNVRRDNFFESARDMLAEAAYDSLKILAKKTPYTGKVLAKISNAPGNFELDNDKVELIEKNSKLLVTGVFKKTLEDVEDMITSEFELLLNVEQVGLNGFEISTVEEYMCKLLYTKYISEAEQLAQFVDEYSDIIGAASEQCIISLAKEMKATFEVAE